MDPTNTTVELPIDTTGEIARYTIGVNRFRRAQTVSVYLNSATSASYRIEFGEKDGNGGIQWFTVDGDFEYPSTTTIHDAWEQPSGYMRLVVTTAAAGGSVATVAVSKGE